MLINKFTSAITLQQIILCNKVWYIMTQNEYFRHLPFCPVHFVTNDNVNVQEKYVNMRVYYVDIQFL